MSFADATISQLDIVGPPGLLHFLATMRSYTFRYALDLKNFSYCAWHVFFFNRDTMPVYPTEASWTLSTSTSPDPLYQDKNLTVYGIPILPSYESSQITSPSSTDPSTVTQSLDHTLKRKREASPESPLKRPALVAEESGLLEKTPSLGDIIHQADFTPVGLTGEIAQEWRKLMVNTMFPGVKEKIEAKKQKHRRERDRDSVPSPSKKSDDKKAGPSTPRSEHAMSTATCESKGPTLVNGNNDAATSNVSTPKADIYIMLKLLYI